MKIWILALLAAAAVGCSSQPKSYAPTASSTPTYEVWREPAAECRLAGDYKECKNARRNDLADQYLLDKKGNLFRAVENQKCQITSNVDSFKISMHPNDSAVAYYESKDDLYVVHNQGTTRSGNCPPVSKKKIMSNVKEYSVVSNTNSFIVNAALDKSGKFEAWDNIKTVYSDKNVEDFMMNTCYKVEGKSFNTIVLFTIDRSGYVTKVRMEESAGGWVYNKSNETNRQYRNIADFKERENVCK